MSRRRKHRYEVPTDAHSTDDIRANVALAITLGAVIAGLALARIFLAAIVGPFSALVVVAQP